MSIETQDFIISWNIQQMPTDSANIMSIPKQHSRKVFRSYSITVIDIQKVVTYQCHHDHSQPASVLCCSRLSCLSSSEHSNPGHAADRNVSISLRSAGLPMTNVQPAVVPGTNIPDVMALSRDDDDGVGAQLLTVPRHQFLTVDDMKQDVSIDTFPSDEDEHCV